MGDEIRLVQSQPASCNRSRVNYHWICFFNWCENDQNPFHIHVREATQGIIPESWFAKPLEEGIRQKKASFEPVDNSVMSVFCKIEYGT